MGSSTSAAKAAEANTQQQQASEAAATTQINNLFASPQRTAEYNQLGTATTQYYMNQLNQQQQVNNRNLTFALARGGQTGGSVATDEATQAGKDYTTGVLDASQRGQAASASLQAADQNTQSNLLAMAQGGLNGTAGAQDATSALQSNLKNAQANATANTIGNAFGDFGQIYTNSTNAAAARQGQLYGYGTAYAPVAGSFGSGGSAAASSTI